MSKEHTEGPWQCKHIAGNNFAVQAFDIRADGYPIFNKDRHAIDGAHVYCSPANARLIAAAPELLEALRSYMGAVSLMNAAMEDGANVHGAISGLIGAEDNARDAIAKATGAV